MKIEITGHINAVDEFARTVLDDALGLWVDKIAADNPDMKEMLDKVVDVDITELTAVLRFKLEGIEEWQQITTDNHEGIAELLTVKVETDEKGNLLTDTVTDNDGNSDFNEFEALIAAGVSGKRKPVATMYDGVELQWQEEYHFDAQNLEIDILTDPEGQVVVQAVEFNEQCDATLVAEAVFPADELEKIKQHYAELEEATV